jgi:RNA polymerase sigma-70 factor (ECF subfamily)
MTKHKFNISSPDHILLLELKEGNSKAFDLIFHRYYNNLCRFAFTFTRDEDTSKNLVQNVFVKLWERRFVIEKVNNLGAYLTTMVRNQVADYISDYKKHMYDSEFKAVIPDHSTENTIMEHDFQQTLVWSLAKLPPRCKQAFELSRMENLSNKEIAEEMKISVKGVEALIGRSLQFLRVELQEYLPSSKWTKQNPILFFFRYAQKLFSSN